MLSKPKSSSQSNSCSASTSGSQLVVVHTKHGSQTSIVTNSSNKSKGNGASSSTASKTQHGSQNTASSDGQTSNLTTSAAHGFPKQNKTGFRFSLRRFLYNSPLVTQRRARSLPTSSSNTLSHATKRQRKSLSKLECESPSESSGSTQQDAASSSASETRSSHTFSKGALDTDILECPLCLAQVPRHLYPDLLNCAHHSCLECMQQYMRIEISESRVDITCPQCSELVHPNDIRSILSNRALVEKYEGFMLRRVLVADPDCRWCPAPDCTFAVIASGCASCPKIRCGRPGCSSYFCYHCKAEWHPNQTCDAARAERTPHLRGSSATFSQESNSRDDLKACPRCQVLIVKMNDGSCNHMTCAVCGAEFCWLCMKEISDLHYLSPSGCTFWGTKPWSRKKKILWQLGTLVGAPVGIALMAGIALPAITIGVPVWVGRKLHTRYKTVSKHKRNLIITSGVTASVLVSPVLAGLAVGIGVPILLAYVYGVVPISLCRSGGCGVSTSASGVRIDFDENETLDNKNQDGLSVDLTGPGRAGNPSIGEVSVSMGSGSHSHLDRGPESDREDCDGASQMGLAGSIASQRLEVQAEVAGRRLSSGSEMASAHVSLPTELDDACASTRGLAGSIYSYKMADRDTCSVQSYKSGSQGDKCVTHQAAEGADGYTPVEVHVQDSLTYQQYAYPGHVSLSPVSSFSLSGDELSLGPSSSVVRRSARRAKFFVDRQISDNSSLVSVEETGTDHVRFDDNVSYIDHDLALEDAPYQTPPESFEGQQPERALPHTVILISSGQESSGKSFVLAPVDAKRDRGTS